MPAIAFTVSQSNVEKSFWKLDHFRIKLHLRLTENLLRSYTPSNFSKKALERRLKSLDHLNDYWKKGEFPKNTNHPGKYIPYFKDINGTPCAMAYLIQKSGGNSLVNEVNKTNNNVYINDIKNGPVLNWIKRLGLTKKEAALVQPSYPCPNMSFDCVTKPPSVFESYILPLIIFGVLFIVYELLFFFFANWFSKGVGLKRVIGITFFTLFSLAISFITYLLANAIFGGIRF